VVAMSATVAKTEEPVILNSLGLSERGNFIFRRPSNIPHVQTTVLAFDKAHLAQLRLIEEVKKHLQEPVLNPVKGLIVCHSNHKLQQ